MAVGFSSFFLLCLGFGLFFCVVTCYNSLVGLGFWRGFFCFLSVLGFRFFWFSFWGFCFGSCLRRCCVWFLLVLLFSSGVLVVSTGSFGGRFRVRRFLSASSFGVGRSSFARRSAACVGAVAGCGWSLGFFPRFCFVLRGCGLLRLLLAVFVASGSGSWASLALALGSGVPCLVFSVRLVFLPVGVFLRFLVVPGWFGLCFCSRCRSAPAFPFLVRVAFP